MSFALYILALVPFYFVGAFPTGVLVGKLYGIDIRNVGSGNVGATNVARSVGRNLGLLTLAIDALKGFLACFLGFQLTHSFSFSALAGLVAVFGHCFSIPGKMKGGKGVATSLGVLIYVDPIISVLACIVFILVFLLTRIVSVASVAAGIAAPIIFMFKDRDDSIAAILAVLALLIVVRHKENLNRLVLGTEPKFRRKI